MRMMLSKCLCGSTGPDKVGGVDMSDRLIFESLAERGRLIHAMHGESKGENVLRSQAYSESVIPA